MGFKRGAKVEESVKVDALRPKLVLKENYLNSTRVSVVGVENKNIMKYIGYTLLGIMMLVLILASFTSCVAHKKFDDGQQLRPDWASNGKTDGIGSYDFKTDSLN